MTDWIKTLITTIGYPGIAFLMIIENVFPPIPSELIMPFAGYICSEEELTLFGVILAGTIGSVAGAIPLYYLGHLVGEEKLKTFSDKYGRWFLISKKDIVRASDWFERHGGATVFFCRMIPGIRSLISIPAGIHKMNLPLFLLYTTLGTAIWAGLLTWLGYELGHRYNIIGDYLDPISYGVLSCFIGWYIYRFIQFNK